MRNLWLEGIIQNYWKMSSKGIKKRQLKYKCSLCSDFIFKQILKELIFFYKIECIIHKQLFLKKNYGFWRITMISELQHQLLSLIKAITLALSCSEARPAKDILFPGMCFPGLAKYTNKCFSDQITPQFFMALL